ncbi:uncharacterized protein LOC120253322 [Dioscorea cayenensis subsp. rotundata]|uniref:Uncharacterized protein LOC120253322 n=1 Tax=Dioscorea cayennensis subsp. rotundata TaxID=55577 RepID=A0AB40AS23_DIOCR|nr:uncharacterized protein LOC120253322 [Dioscorea cayenensis subsp. rotundata]
MAVPPARRGLIRKILAVLLVGLAAWLYQSIQPPVPKICGTPNGPPVTSPRIKLKDGRHLAYLESGVPKEKAKYQIVFIHGLDCTKSNVFPFSLEVLEELGVHVLSFDRPGYGESDPNLHQTVKSIALDVEELADQLKLGPKFHVIGFSLGGQLVWSCLKYIPHRLAGAAIVAPIANYWWHNLPANLSKETFAQQPPRDQWAIRVAHYAPWLTFWWNTQKWFPASSVLAHRSDHLDAKDKEILLSVGNRYSEQVRQQGDFVSVHQDLIISYQKWEFDPMDLKNPFPANEGSVHLWHGARDIIAPVSLTRYFAEQLPWIHYHELPDAGHLFPLADDMSDAILKALLA